MPTVYLFGFEAFNGRASNASWEAVAAVPDQLARTKVVKQMLPVAWGEPFPLLQRTVDLKRKPAAVIAVGEAPRGVISVETWGYNERVARPDNLGHLPSSLVIHQETTDRISIPWNPTPLVTRLADHYPLELSTDPGRFLCNELIYELYRDYAHFEGAFPVCFIHVPHLGTKISSPAGELTASRESLGKMLTEFIKGCLPAKKKKAAAV